MGLQLQSFVHYFTKFTCILLFSGLLFCCGKKDKDPEKTEIIKKGFDYSQERPEGTPFQLPSSVTINGPIKGYSIFQNEFCDNKDDKDAKGVGDLVRVCIPFFNNSNSRVTVTFPPGLIFISKNLKIQNGILVEQVIIEIPPKEVFYLPLFLCCINASRSPSNTNEEFELGPVTNDKDMLDLVNWLNTKNMTGGPFISAWVQSAVWSVSRGEPIKAQDKTDIMNLPNK
jgi:hypothetical protein